MLTPVILVSVMGSYIFRSQTSQKTSVRVVSVVSFVVSIVPLFLVIVLFQLAELGFKF
jgi:hypothetical protein